MKHLVSITAAIEVEVDDDDLQHIDPLFRRGYIEEKALDMVTLPEDWELLSTLVTPLRGDGEKMSEVEQRLVRMGYDLEELDQDNPYNVTSGDN